MPRFPSRSRQFATEQIALGSHVVANAAFSVDASKRCQAMGLSVVVEDVMHCDASGCGSIRNQRSMTAPRHCLRAHDGSGLGGGCCKEILESFVKLSGLHVIGIAPEAWVPPQRIVRIPAHFSTPAERGEMRVPNELFRECALEVSLVEMRKARRCGKGAHIHEMRHAFPFQETSELVESPGRMSDRIKLTGGHAPRSCRLRREVCPTAA